MSSSDTGSKEDRAMLLMLGLVIETGADDCSVVLIFLILSLKKFPKEFARSLGLTWLGKIMVEDLCRIFLKVRMISTGVNCEIVPAPYTFILLLQKLC